MSPPERRKAPPGRRRPSHITDLTSDHLHDSQAVSCAAAEALADVGPIVLAAEEMQTRFLAGAYLNVDRDLAALAPVAVAALLGRARRRIEQAVA